MVRQVVAPVLVILFYHRRIGTVAAAGQDNTLGRIHCNFGSVRLLGLSSHNLSAIIRSQRNCSCLCVNGNSCVFCRFLKSIYKRFVRRYCMGSWPHGSQHGKHGVRGICPGLCINANGFHPFKCIQRVLCQRSGHVNVRCNPSSIIQLTKAAYINMPHM